MIDWGKLLIKTFAVICCLGALAAFAGYCWSVWNYPCITLSFTALLLIYVWFEDKIKEHIYKRRHK